MFPILISVIVTAPILALGTWLYLQRRTLSPGARILLMTILFLLILISGPSIMWMWSHGGTTREIVSTARSSGVRSLGLVPLCWLVGVVGVGIQLFRLCRDKGQI